MKLELLAAIVFEPTCTTRTTLFETNAIQLSEKPITCHHTDMVILAQPKNMRPNTINLNIRALAISQRK